MPGHAESGCAGIAAAEHAGNACTGIAAADHAGYLRYTADTAVCIERHDVEA